jgi:hypothetical protein
MGKLDMEPFQTARCVSLVSMHTSYRPTLQREVSTSSTWDGGCLYAHRASLDHSQNLDARDLN